MNKLDLHGLRHSEVSQAVDSFLYKNIDKLPVEIITGYSDRMKDIVIESVKDHRLEYQIGDSLGINTGYIKVY